MKIHSFLKKSEANGPGKRAVVWVQGCGRHCKGCFNLSAQNTDSGKIYTPEAIFNKIFSEEIEGLSVSGGEPFEQPDELEKLLFIAKQRGLNTLVFSGFTYEELYEKKFKALEFCDYLIDGPFKQEIPSKCRWAGSGNQRFLKLENGKLVEDLTDSEKFSRTGEIIIDEKGNITLTGFIIEEFKK